MASGFGGVTRTVIAGGAGTRWRRGRAWRGSRREAAGWPWAGQAGPEAAARPALAALVVACLDGCRIAGLACGDRERLQADGPGHGRMVLAAGEHDLQERQAAGELAPADSGRLAGVPSTPTAASRLSNPRCPLTSARRRTGGQFASTADAIPAACRASSELTAALARQILQPSATT